jgi:diguanylate cyclase (GGDEF)-like protein/hemerythrin-like metal-binding protein
MESFKWGPHFVTGISDVDDQHQALVTMINSFGEAIAENNLSEDLLFSTIKELATYTQVHFQSEEKLMTSMQLDLRHTRNHMDQHNEFIIDITNFTDTLDVEKNEDNRSLFEYLVHWLAYHILGVDKNMARQIAAIRAGASPSEAYQNEERNANSSTEPLLVALKGLFGLVSKRSKALSELNRTLEQHVTARTKELSMANEALEVISVTDHLTQLPNRRFAMGQLPLLWAEATKHEQSLACLMIDADDFKSINDTQGHDAGDAVLQRLAQELQHSVRSDDIVCRLGGDEFLIICPNTSLEGALILGEQTRANVAALKVTAGDGFWFGSVSIGVASTNSEIKNIDALMKSADMAVYIAKKDGRNCVRSLSSLSKPAS